MITRDDDLHPEHETLLADSVGLALMVVLETLNPAESLAFVPHDMFAVPFDEIADVVDRTPGAARQLASRVRRRVRDVNIPDRDPANERKVVAAFFAAVREGDFDALLAVLDPDIVLRSDGGRLRAHGSVIVRGAEAVDHGAVRFRRLGATTRRARVDGQPGAVAFRDEKPYSVMSLTVAHGKVVAIDILVDPERIRDLDLSAIADAPN